ncbi:uncharacterized protein [Antedon mediterranea]|uniref:uncharacterized protein n=1 Tax=Antedon mediterranea TaxID=105859 RepID=UPI003AF93236
MLSQNASHGSAMCNQVEPGTKVGLTINSQTNSVDGEPAHIIMISNPDQVEFTSQNSSFLYVFVKWKIMSGSVSAFNVSCSVGEPASIVVNTLDGSGSVKCSDVGPGVQVVVNVVAVHYSKQAIPSLMVLSTSKLVNVTLVEDTTGTNTSTVVAKLTSDTTQSVPYNVECSEGNPSPSGMMEANMTKDVFCDGLEAGNTVDLSVRFVHGTGNLSVGFSSISISTSPEMVVLFEMTDLSQFQSMLDNGFSFGVATWNQSGTADLFKISCSDGTPFPGVIQINDPHIGMCEMSQSLAETVEITVTPELNGKEGHPATIVVPVVGNRRDAGSDYPSSANELTTDNSLNETTSSGLTNSSGHTTSSGLTTSPYNLVNITLIENNATNTTIVVAKMSSDATQIVSYTVTCSEGTPSTSGTVQSNMTKIVSCFGLEAGTNVDLSVELNYNNTPLGSAVISISTIPAMVFLFEITDMSQFQGMLDDGFSFGVATWNLTSGTADLFRISCSDDGLPFPGVIQINDPHIGMCEMSESLSEKVEITVTPELNGKEGHPVTVVVTVVGNRRDAGTDYPSSADELTTDNSLNETTSSGLTNSSGQTTSSGLTTSPYNLVNITLIENNATNTTIVVAKMSSDATQIVSYTVTCSEGTPSTSGTVQSNMTKIVSCFGLEAGTNVDLSVELNYNNTPLGSAVISISTIPAMVVLFEITDISQFQGMLDDGFSFGVATWNLTSGTADLFRISCSDDGLPFPGVIQINDPHIGMCEMSESLAETVEITVTPELNGKKGHPATVTVVRQGNDRSGN